MGLRTLNVAIDQLPTSSLTVTSATLDPVPTPSFAQGDTETVTIVLHKYNPAGSYSTKRQVCNISGYSFRLAIGSPGGTPAALQDTWAIAGDGLSATATFALNTSGIDALVASVNIASSSLSLKVNDGTGWRTLVLRDCAVYKTVDDNTSNVPTPATEYYDRAAADALFVKRVMPAGGSITFTSPDGTKQTVMYLDDDGTIHQDVVN